MVRVWLILALLGAAEARAGDCRVILVPGAFAAGSSGSNLFLAPEDYFADYRAFFKEKGCEIHLAEFPPDATIEARGLILKDQARRFIERTGGKPAVIVGHSQAGLDARYALKSLQLTGIRALVTIGTPHHGSRVADWAVDQRDRGSVLYWLVRWIGRYDLRELPFLGEFTASFIVKHGDHFEAVRGVQYLSAQGVCRTDCHWALRLVDWWVGVGEGDGLSNRSSQEFGNSLGEYDLDHISEVDASPGKKSERRRFLENIWKAVFESSA